MALAPGTRLGPYEILSPLGAGGMGEVYRARDTRLEREVAVKVLPAGFAAHADRLARFEQEARATSALNHPNILAIHDLGSHEGVPYIVSELLEGQTLRERLADGPLPMRKAAEIAAQVARGLAAAHERGIVHRDLKPENLFITRDGRAKVLDFGLAKLTKPETPAGEVSSLPTTPAGTEAGIVMGTVGYMAPEQVRGKGADQRSDLFALGAILYEMLSGRRAFAGESAVETMHAILKDEPPDLVSIDRSIPPALDRIVRHCLEKNPDERFHSARDVAFYLDTLPGLATPAEGTPALAGPGARAPRRFMVPALALVAAAAVVAAGVFYQEAAGVHPASVPTFQRLTFRHGFLHTARFTHDGQSVVYGAAWDGNPIDVYLTHPGTPESRSLGLERSTLLAISPSDELAVMKFTGFGSTNLYNAFGTLARMPLTGGSPREVVERVTYADWAPDGKTVAVVRDLGDRHRLEYPIGRTLYETPHFLFNPRISPDGRMVALWETYSGQSTLIVIDQAGTIRGLSPGWSDWWYLSWSPDGREIWYGASSVGYSGALYAVDLAGHRRLLYSGPGEYDVQDVFRDGRALLGAVKQRQRTTAVLSGWSSERDLSWFDGTTVADVSADGNSLLLREESEAGGPRQSAFLQKKDGSPPIRLGEGNPFSLSPDGRWAIAALGQHDLVLLPIGTGEARPLGYAGFDGVEDAQWLPDGKRIVVLANEPGHHLRLFLIDADGTSAKPLSDEGFSERSVIAIAPDGRRVAAVMADGRLVLVPTDGGKPGTAPGLENGDLPVSWSADGQALFVLRKGTPPVSIFRIDLRSGRREVWKELPARDPAGVATLSRAVMTRDGKAYAYTYEQILTDLYLVEGLK